MGCQSSQEAKDTGEEGPVTEETKNGDHKIMDSATTDFKWEDDVDDTAADLAPDTQPMKKAASRKHRASVSAECYVPGQEKGEKKYVAKTEEEKNDLRQRLAKIFLFKHLDSIETEQLVDALEPKDFKTGDLIIEEGDSVAEWFYILLTGTAEAYKEEKMVYEYKGSGSFGELALMYNAPRAATVKAVTDCSCWALDRRTFRTLVIDSMAAKRESYERFLADVPLLSSLSDSERSAIADVLNPIAFADGEAIIEEGQEGTAFYLVEHGEVDVTTQAGGDKPIKSIKRGDYFGELALLNSAPRKATCKAKGAVSVVCMDKAAFTRMLGKVEDILRRNMSQYEQYQSEIQN